MNEKNKLQLKVLIWRNLIYKKRNKLSTSLEIIVPTIILLLLCKFLIISIYLSIYLSILIIFVIIFILYIYLIVFVSKKNGIINDVLEINAELYNFNNVDDLQYIDLYFGFIFPNNFEKKDEFMNNFKSLNAIKNNKILDSFENDYRKRDVDTEYQNDIDNDIIYNPINMKIIEQKILNADVILNASFNENNFNSSTVIVNNTLIQDNDYFDLYPNYEKINLKYRQKYDSLDIISYNFNKPPSYNTDKCVHIAELDNESELSKYELYGLYGIVFSSQNEYTVRKYGILDISEFIKPKYEKLFQSNEYAYSEIKNYALVQNLVDQALIKTFTNFNEVVQLYDKTMDQEEVIYEFSDNPANTYLPYLILFFFMLVFV